MVSRNEKKERREGSGEVQTEDRGSEAEGMDGMQKDISIDGRSLM